MHNFCLQATTDLPHTKVVTAYIQYYEKFQLFSILFTMNKMTNKLGSQSIIAYCCQHI